MGFLQGIWSGMIGGICLQTLILIIVTSITNWKREVSTSCSFLLLVAIGHKLSLSSVIELIQPIHNVLFGD